MAQLHEMSLELEGKKSNCRLLQQENQMLSSNIGDLKMQQVRFLFIVSVLLAISANLQYLSI